MPQPVIDWRHDNGQIGDLLTKTGRVCYPCNPSQRRASRGLLKRVYRPIAAPEYGQKLCEGWRYKIPLTLNWSI
jgi:hypothetical protein